MYLNLLGLVQLKIFGQVTCDSDCYEVVPCCVIIFDSEYAGIWVINDYGVKESWSKDFVIRRSTNYYELIMVFENGKILMAFTGDAFFLYDPKLEHYGDVQTYGIMSQRYDQCPFAWRSVSVCVSIMSHVY